MAVSTSIEPASQQTRVTGSFDSGGFDRAAFDTHHLEIEVEVLDKKTWIPADIIIEDLVKFWRNFLRENGPYGNNLPMPRAHLTDFK